MWRNVIVDIWMKNEMCETKMSRNVTECNEILRKYEMERKCVTKI